jgi:hypothetical protein
METCLKYKQYVLGGHHEGRKPLWGPRSRWEYNIKRDVKENAWGHGWIYLVQNRDMC